MLCLKISFFPDWAAEGERNYHNVQHSCFIIHLVTFNKMHFQNDPHGQTLPRQGCMQHIGAMEYTMYTPHPLLPQAVTWHLCSAWRLRGARCWMEPIVLILLVVKPTDASTKTIALLLLLQRRSDFSLSVLTLFLPCRSTFSMNMNVHESMQLDHSRVLLCQAGPIYLNNYHYFLGFTVCVSV